MSQVVLFEATPNPQAMKFVVTDRVIANEVVQFANSEEALRSPLARKLFGFPWAAQVMVGPQFVTVTKQEWVEWSVLAEPLANLIEEHITSDQAVLLPPSESTGPKQSDQNVEDENDSAVVKEIKRILNQEIRPAVAMDGGDISFHSYQDGRLLLEMRGSCSGCPSSTYTLKEGIETRLKASIPDLKEVLSV